MREYVVIAGVRPDKKIINAAYSHGDDETKALDHIRRLKRQGWTRCKILLRGV